MKFLAPWVRLTVLIAIAMGTEAARRSSLPDSYRLLGNPGLRIVGQCNITYAWLTPPPASTLDAYGHKLACTRLALKDGRVFRNEFADEMEYTESMLHTRGESATNDNTAAMVDLRHLDELLRADSRGNGQFAARSAGSQLADDNRYFFLDDRVGDLNVMILLRPGQPIKIELMDLSSVEHLFTPQHVLCCRKHCPPVQIPKTDSVKDSNADVNFARNLNNSLISLASLSRAERQNRDLYMQLIISRVACALLSVLCLVFAITALTLCIRLRRKPFSRRKSQHSQLSICPGPNQSPNYYQPNGKLAMRQPSPAYLADLTPRHAHLTSDNTSVTNLVMTASNLSDCGAVPGFHAPPLSYTTINSPYGQLAAYPMHPGHHGSLYNENTGLMAYVPVNSHGMVLPYQNGSSSPAHSNRSLNEAKPGVVRTGSVGRCSGSNISCGDNSRRRLLRVSRGPHIGPKSIESQLLQNDPEFDGPMDPSPNTPILGVTQSMDMGDKMNGSQRTTNLINFKSHMGSQPQVIHRYPNEHVTSYNKQSTPCGSVNEDRGSVQSNNAVVSHTHETCVNVIRKPALANM